MPCLMPKMGSHVIALLAVDLLVLLLFRTETDWSLVAYSLSPWSLHWRYLCYKSPYKRFIISG